MKRAAIKPQQLTAEQQLAIENAVFIAVEPLVDARFYLLDVAMVKESGQWYLRIFVENQGEAAISLSDCETVSRAIDPVLETIHILRDLTFSLEVSSPGLFRPLRKAREFAYYLNHAVRIQQEKPAAKKQLPPEVLHVEEGVLIAVAADLQSITVCKAGADNPLEIMLTNNTVVYLNPQIQFPEDAEAVEPSPLS